PATAVAINAGTSSASFYFKGTLARSVTVTAAGAGLSSPTQVETIAPGSPTALAFTTAGQSVTAGACSAQVAVEAQDALGNPSGVTASTSVALSAAPS